MNPAVILFQSGKEDMTELTEAFSAGHVKILRCRSLAELHALCQENDRCAVVLDLDNAMISNRVLKDLKTKHPFIQMIGISDRSFHPELKESMQSYLYACVSKPVDLEEIMYLVQSIFRDLAGCKRNKI
ncbi:hypothetical protein [Desulfomonile tiedjei]|uniref:Response regulatory domain-containing protein n=1 Tax=Desulfomonile tiedjei (strain ATCC 49306 / DSM 6799 / DCB-1) TaxID=706587 RepID=I4CEI1_DESTA|nr:hypothetical protein [Desulfomonile tiedjei]AFM27972.1 hypothetical protein Desti_5384 [Desulfomonile tiedjei DSM 6799]